MSIDAIEEISDEEWEKTLSTNISAMFYVVKSAVPHMPEGSCIINTASVNADAPESSSLGLRHHQRSDSEFYRGACSAFGGERDQGQLGRAWADLDAVDPFDDAR